LLKAGELFIHFFTLSEGKSIIVELLSAIAVTELFLSFRQVERDIMQLSEGFM
jgi:hypothetical protein